MALARLEADGRVLQGSFTGAGVRASGASAASCSASIVAPSARCASG